MPQAGTAGCESRARLTHARGQCGIRHSAVRYHAHLLGRKARAALTGGAELWLSPISAWEATLLAQRGKIRLNIAPEDCVLECIANRRVWLREAALAALTYQSNAREATRYLEAVAAGGESPFPLLAILSLTRGADAGIAESEAALRRLWRPAQ